MGLLLHTNPKCRFVSNRAVKTIITSKQFVLLTTFPFISIVVVVLRMRSIVNDAWVASKLQANYKVELIATPTFS